MCGQIAADEARHELAYTAIVAEIMRHDPDGALLAIEDMMKKGILMPAHYVDDGWHSEANQGQNLFTDYATVADALGVYTTHDYASIVEHLVSACVACLQFLPTAFPPSSHCVLHVSSPPCISSLSSNYSHS
jgi:acyl-[acyl-carrier-protein] desaturase